MGLDVLDLHGNEAGRRPTTSILALPFAVLRTLDYRGADFDAAQGPAITAAGRGRNDKLQLQFDARFWDAAGAWPGIWNGNSYADTGYQNTWDVTRAQAGTAGSWSTTPAAPSPARSRVSTPYATARRIRRSARTPRRFLRQIESVYPDISRHWTGRASLSVPSLDPNLKTSYSYWKVGQYHDLRGIREHASGQHPVRG